MGVTLLPICFSITWLVKHFVLFYDNCYFFLWHWAQEETGIENGWLDYHYLEVSWLTCLISSKTPPVLHWHIKRTTETDCCRSANRVEWAPDCLLLPPLHLGEGRDLTGHWAARAQEQRPQRRRRCHLWQVCIPAQAALLQHTSLPFHCTRRSLTTL